jgi:hypothetical protein
MALPDDNQVPPSLIVVGFDRSPAPGSKPSRLAGSYEIPFIVKASQEADRQNPRIVLDRRHHQCSRKCMGGDERPYARRQSVRTSTSSMRRLQEILLPAASPCWLNLDQHRALTT